MWLYSSLVHSRQHAEHQQDLKAAVVREFEQREERQVEHSQADADSLLQKLIRAALLFANDRCAALTKRTYARI